MGIGGHEAAALDDMRELWGDTSVAAKHLNSAALVAVLGCRYVEALDHAEAALALVKGGRPIAFTSRLTGPMLARIHLHIDVAWAEWLLGNYVRTTPSGACYISNLIFAELPWRLPPEAARERRTRAKRLDEKPKDDSAPRRVAWDELLERHPHVVVEDYGCGGLAASDSPADRQLAVRLVDEAAEAGFFPFPPWKWPARTRTMDDDHGHPAREPLP